MVFQPGSCSSVSFTQISSIQPHTCTVHTQRGAFHLERAIFTEQQSFHYCQSMHPDYSVSYSGAAGQLSAMLLMAHLLSCSILTPVQLGCTDSCWALFHRIIIKYAHFPTFAVLLHLIDEKLRRETMWCCPPFIGDSDIFFPSLLFNTSMLGICLRFTRITAAAFGRSCTAWVCRTINRLPQRADMCLFGIFWCRGDWLATATTVTEFNQKLRCELRRMTLTVSYRRC